MTKPASAYAKAGVNIDVMMSALSRAKRTIRSTATPDVISDVGSFGGLHTSPGRDHVLVSSIDGVGTKLKVAAMAGVHHTIGQDLVNHCVNDILTQGARPLFFLDYLGASALEPKVFADVVTGIAKACRKNGCALIGGETAEMPGLYPKSEYDLVGAIVGTVQRKKLITGETIRAGDVLIGLPSNGLHTNGYTLARHILFKQARLKIDAPFPGTKRSVAQVLLAVHKSYLKPVMAVLDEVSVPGLAHITSGGLLDNLPRIFPDDVHAQIDRSTWKVPQVFQVMQECGKVETPEMFRVFNMGIGMVLVVRARQADRVMEILRESGERPKRIGCMVAGGSGVELDG